MRPGVYLQFDRLVLVDRSGGVVVQNDFEGVAAKLDGAGGFTFQGKRR
ncbi:MAG: hypothetical protein ACLP01_24635 [Solirubrobacteraceae bacterium]